MGIFWTCSCSLYGFLNISGINRRVTNISKSFTYKMAAKTSWHFINDLDNGLSSTVLKFADDTKLVRPVNKCTDGQELQLDLDSVCS